MRARRARIAAAWGLAFAGTWLSHTAVYIRLHGEAGLRDELFGAAHLYMLPAAALLLALAGMAAGGWWGRWRALGLRVDEARAAVRTVLRGGVAPAPGDVTVPASTFRSIRFASLWPRIAAIQLALYTLQENLEAWRSGHALSGAGVLWQDGGAPLLIHLAIAVLLSLLLLVLVRTLARREHAAVVWQRFARWLARWVVRGSRVAAGTVANSPLERFGCQLHRRPPPVAVRP